jgi:hypothetical protein
MQGIRIPSRHEPRCSERDGGGRRWAQRRCYAWAILLATVRSRSRRSLLAWKAASLQACMPELRGCQRERRRWQRRRQQLVARRLDSILDDGVTWSHGPFGRHLPASRAGAELTSCDSLASCASRKTPSGNAGNPPQPSARPRGTASGSPSSPAWPRQVGGRPRRH